MSRTRHLGLYLAPLLLDFDPVGIGTALKDKDEVMVAGRDAYSGWHIHLRD